MRLNLLFTLTLFSVLTTGAPARAAPLTCKSLFTRLTATKISPRESALLDRAVLRDFEDLTDFAAPSKKVAQAWNARVLSALDRQKLPKVNPPEKAGLTAAELDALAARAKANDVIENSCQTPSRYEKDPDVSIGFCFGRAIGVHLMARQQNLSNESIRKVWLVGEMESGDITWSHHVATAVRRDDGKWYVVDPATKILQPLEAWLKDWQEISTDGRMSLFATKPDRFGPESPDPLFESTTEPDSYNGFFHDLFASARREGEDVARQLELLSSKKPRKSRPAKKATE